MKAVQVPETMVVIRSWSNWRARWKLAGVLLVIVRCLSGPGYAQSNQNQAASYEALPPDAREQLAKQTRAMQAIQLEFTELFGGNGSGDVSGEPTSYSVYFEGSHFYGRKQYLNLYQGRKQPHVHEIAFEGQLFYHGDQEQAPHIPAFLTKYLPSDQTDPDRTKKTAEFPYLEAAGFYAPQRIMELPDFSGVESLVLRYLRQSSKTEVAASAEAVRISVRVPDRYLVALREMDLEQRRKEIQRSASPSAYVAKRLATYQRLREAEPVREVTFVLDPKHGYGIAEREERTATGQRFLRIESTDWKFYKDADIWLPGKCVVSWYTSQDDFDVFSTEPIQIITLTLKSLELGRKAVACSLDYRIPGTRITDRSTAEARERPLHQVSYTVAANGAVLRDVARNVGMELKRGKLALWMVVFLVIAAVPPIVCAFQGWRKRKS